MLADDVVGRIAFDPLGACVPVGYPASGVEHVDRVIGDALDEDSEAALRLEQRLLRLALLGHVPCDFCEAEQLAFIAVDPVDDDAGPKPRAILAYAPAFPFETAFAARGLEHPLGHARPLVFFGVEFGEVLADDLFGLEALDPLGTRVPAGHDSIGVEHVDGIVEDRLDEQLERFFGYGAARQLEIPGQTPLLLHAPVARAPYRITLNVRSSCRILQQFVAIA